MKRLWITLAILQAVSIAWSQTAIDLRAQGKNVDFSGAAFTRPMKTGTVLPAVCQTGEVYFRTTDVPGQNLWACAATNTWTRLSGTISSVFGRSGVITKAKGDYNLADLGDVSGKQGTGTTALMFGGGTTTNGDCAQFDAGGNVISAGVPCGSGSGGVQAGTGVAVTTSGSASIVAIDTAVVPTYMIASPLIDFPSIPAQTCSEQTVTFPGIAVGNGILPAWPETLENGLIGIVRASAANTALVRLCNITGASINPASQIFSLTAVRSF